MFNVLWEESTFPPHVELRFKGYEYKTIWYIRFVRAGAVEGSEWEKGSQNERKEWNSDEVLIRMTTENFQEKAIY